MPVAYYMRFVKGHHGALDRVGGLPSHLPPAVPLCPTSGQEMAFLAQFYCTLPRLGLSNTLCVQLYQAHDVGEGGDPVPVAIRVPIGSPANINNGGRPHPQVVSHDVCWEERKDPDAEPPFPDDLPLYQSKIGGLCLHSDLFGESEQFLMQLKEEPGNFNFAGRTCLLSLADDGSLKVYLG
jgi:hypothetical protein